MADTIKLTEKTLEAFNFVKEKARRQQYEKNLFPMWGVYDFSRCGCRSSAGTLPPPETALAGVFLLRGVVRFSIAADRHHALFSDGRGIGHTGRDSDAQGWYGDLYGRFDWIFRAERAGTADGCHHRHRTCGVGVCCRNRYDEGQRRVECLADDGH